MGRPPKDVDTELMVSLLSMGMTKADVAGIMGVTSPTIEARINDLRKEENALLAYDKCRYLDLISVQQRLVAGVTDAKIEEAPLGQIAQAFGVFNKAEMLVQGKPTEIHGLMGFLLQLDKEDVETAKSKIDNGEVEEAEFASAEPEQLELGF